MAQQIFDQYAPLAKVSANETIPVVAAIAQTRDGKDELLHGTVPFVSAGDLYVPVSAANRLPVEATLTGSNVMQDVRTLSTTPLGANEFYNQTAQIAKDVVVGNVRGVAYIGAMVYADVPGVLMLQERHGSVWMQSGRWPVGGGERQTIPLQPITTGIYRWRYVNGSTAQSAFELYEFVSQIDGRVRPFHIHVLQGAVIPAGGSKFMGQTQLLGYNHVAIYVRCDRQYSLDAYPGVGIGVSRSVNVVRDEAATGSGAKYHQIPSEVLPTLNLDVKITNEDPSNDATVDMWLVATS